MPIRAGLERGSGAKQKARNSRRGRERAVTVCSACIRALWLCEDADYEGHSVAMLRRIAAALNRRVEIRFVPIRESA